MTVSKIINGIEVMFVEPLELRAFIKTAFKVLIINEFFYCLKVSIQ